MQIIFFRGCIFFLAKNIIRTKKYSALKKNTQTFFFSAEYFFFSANAANFRNGQKSVMGNSLGTCGGTWCVQGPRDGTGDEASLILPPPPPSLDLHPCFTHFYLFAHSHHIHSFSGLIAPHPRGALTCEV